MSPLLLAMIGIARNLSDPAVSNREYIRGQAELICDVFGLDTETSRGEIMLMISQGGDDYPREI